jgi:hypothetical protein
MASIEAPAKKFFGSAIPQLRVSGVCILAFEQHGLLNTEVSPTEAKKRLHGSGKATKEEMLRAAWAYLNFGTPVYLKTVGGKLLTMTTRGDLACGWDSFDWGGDEFVTGTGGKGQALQWAYNIVRGDDPVDLTGTNNVAALNVMAATNQTTCWLAITGTITVATNGTAEFDVASTNANMPAGEYAAYVQIREMNGTSVVRQIVAAAHPINYCALRYFNVAGADPKGRSGQSTVGATHLIKIAVEAAIGKRDAVGVYGTDFATRDGTGVRDYIHVSDLAAAHVAASPAGATDLAQTTADIVLQREGLAMLRDAIRLARRAQILARQNIGFSLAYNVIAVPAAIAGLVNPLIAALVMASSSLIVIGNALRAGRA